MTYPYHKSGFQGRFKVITRPRNMLKFVFPLWSTSMPIFIRHGPLYHRYPAYRPKWPSEVVTSGSIGPSVMAGHLTLLPF